MDILKSLKDLKLGGKKNDTDPVKSAEPKRIKEINLVPDIKNDFIKTLKFRNFVFFLCIVVASASTIVILIFLTIAGGQQGFINAKQNTIETLERKIADYSDLSDFLTIRDQLANIATITENKVMASRTFNIISAIIPTGDDYINVSELSVELEDEEGGKPTLTIDAQANAGTEPKIDYKVLDSFKKSMRYLRYDYGEYVDKNDQTIPAYCIIETGADGSTLRDVEKGYYAYWLIDGEGCNPSVEEEEEEETTPTLQSSSLQTPSLQTPSLQTSNSSNQDLLKQESPIKELVSEAETLENLSKKTGYSVSDFEKYNNQNVIRIWRTPQYTEWYKANPGEKDVYMSLDGSIHNIAHFNSACISYNGTEKDKNAITWTATNDSCLLVPDNEEGGEGIKIESSSNGRNAEGELVLRFNAKIFFAPEVFNFNNHHMLAIPPAGRRNVTDSYSQIQSIFAERATDCDKNDTECVTTPTSENANNSSSNQNVQTNQNQTNQTNQNVQTNQNQTNQNQSNQSNQTNQTNQNQSNQSNQTNPSNQSNQNREEKEEETW